MVILIPANGYVNGFQPMKKLFFSAKTPCFRAVIIVYSHLKRFHYIFSGNYVSFLLVFLTFSAFSLY